MKPEKIHTANYYETFIIVADDCRAVRAEEPPLNERSKSIARMQYELLKDNPYRFSSDDVLFHVFAHKNEIPEKDWEQRRKVFFSKGQACLRCSPLAKRYGWGIHHNEDGKVAIYGMETAAYKKFAGSKSLAVVKAMRSSKRLPGE